MLETKKDVFYKWNAKGLAMKSNTRINCKYIDRLTR